MQAGEGERGRVAVPNGLRHLCCLADTDIGMRLRMTILLLGVVAYTLHRAPKTNPYDKESCDPIGRKQKRLDADTLAKNMNDHSPSVA